MYAILLKFNEDIVKQHYSLENNVTPYSQIESLLNDFGFEKECFNFYTPKGSNSPDSVSATLALITVMEKLPWTIPSLTEAKILRIEEVINAQKIKDWVLHSVP